MTDIYRVFECRNGVLTELVFIQSVESMKEYLYSCNLHNTDQNVFYFSQKIKIEK